MVQEAVDLHFIQIKAELFQKVIFLRYTGAVLMRERTAEVFRKSLLILMDAVDLSGEMSVRFLKLTTSLKTSGVHIASEWVFRIIHV